MKRFDVQNYQTEAGDAPFQDWLLNLADHKAQTTIVARIDRATHGNFGDWKAISGAKGLFEMRIHYGQGYRLFYTVVCGKFILLLAGSEKRDQDKMIAKASEYLADYNRRVKP